MKTPPRSRREFLQLAALGGAALGGAALGLGGWSLPRAAAAPPDFAGFREPGRLVQIYDERALTSLLGEPQREVVRAMVDRAVLTLTGKKTREEAWACFVHASDVVGLKPNCLGGRKLSTSPHVVDAVIDGLESAGVKRTNIIVWEQNDRNLGSAGFKKGTRDDGVLFTTFMKSYPDGDFGPEQEHGAGTSRYCEVVHRCSAIINLPVFKDHGIAGITVSMKNLTHGTVNNPRDYHHKNSGEIAHLYAHPILRDKVRLTLADALRLEYDGGPRDSPRKVLHHSLYASTDPVAVDATALRLIEGHRKEKGLRSLKKAGRAATHVGKAQDLGLGFAESDKLKLEKVTLG